MKVHHIHYRTTGYFSKLICDYLGKDPSLSDFYENTPNIEGFKKQIELKQAEENVSEFPRDLLVAALKSQYKNLNISENTALNIEVLKDKNTYTITTGHQLNIFTGPMYFLYKIVSVINLTKQLKKEFPAQKFVPIYWMATEDHDFEEINYFNFKNKKIQWKTDDSGAVGRLNTDGFEAVFNEFSQLLNNSENADYLRNLFKNAYLKHSSLTEATRYLVNELFTDYGLVVIDGDYPELKQHFAPIVKDELLSNISFQQVSKSNDLLGEKYKIQVNPREINLFYLENGLRERIIFENDMFKINGTSRTFSKDEILEELQNFPERFSPNVIMRPLYQEAILPNLAYIGGGGEIAYWFQLKKYFEVLKIPFPILLLRNSVMMMSSKQFKKMTKLNISLDEIFIKQESLINKKVKEISEVAIDFTNQKLFLQQQFITLKELANKTDKSFEGAVFAQEKKQLNGLDKLEKRLLKAQKRKLANEIERLKLIQNELFPNQSLQERTCNFSEYYLKLGSNFIPMLFEALKPLKQQFAIIEY